jgi:hypothetical protein
MEGFYMTRKTAGAVVLALVLALVAPGFTQPFADVPTNHWAYDAIAELAAKGLIEGYPDGTFKGNQPLTRYEMAMVVARIIARIEAIPTPPPPEVRRADLDAVRRDLTAATGRIAVTERDIAALQRLVNEFRAELQALGVRVTALEEELQALRARLDNTRVTGLFDAWYVVNQLAGTNAIPIWPRFRLQFTGTVAPDVSVFIRPRWFSNTGNQFVLDYDLGYLEVRNFLGWEGLTLRAGLDRLTLGAVVGLLLSEPSYDPAHRTGVSLTGSLGPFRFLAFTQFADPTNAFGPTVYGGRLSFGLLPGWTLGVNGRWDRNVLGTTQQGQGFSADLVADLVSGLRLRVEYASYSNDTLGQQGNYLFADLTFNLAQLAGMETFNPVITVWYKNYDVNWLPAPAPGLVPGNFTAYGWPFVTIGNRDDLNTFGARLDLTLFENVGVWVASEFGNIKSTNQSWNLWFAGARWEIAPRTPIMVYYANTQVAGTNTFQTYGAYISTSW